MKPHKQVRNPRMDLEADHQRINSLLDRVLLCARGDDGGGARVAWDKLERVLLAHLDAEEMYVLPKMETDEPSECAKLRHEHARFRSTLAEIGLGLDLHVARCDVIEEFAETLRAHAEREDVIAYPYAQRTLSEPETHSLFARLRGLEQRVRAYARPKRAAPRRTSLPT